jgi:hypothetical protein
VNIIQQLTVISSDAVRDEITRKIDTLKAKGGTCLGAGLKNGMNVSLFCKIPLNIVNKLKKV